MNMERLDTIREFLSHVEPRIYDRGARYYEDGMVARLVRDGAHCSAKVSGSDWEPYDVDILLTENDRVKDWYCTCPYDGGDVCKHVVAALIAIQNGETKAKKPASKADGKKAEAPPEMPGASGQELAAAKDSIRASIRRNTHRGYIDMRGCDAVCYDMDDVLETARRRMERGQYPEAIALAQEMLMMGAKLACEADTSSGSLNDTMAAALELLEDAAARLADSESAEKRPVFDGILKAAKNKAFDGWDEWRYSILNCAASLADKNSASKLNALLEQLLAAADQTEYGRDYMVEANFETRFHLISAMDGPQAARAFLSEHLELPRLRELAVSLDMEAGDYARAEKLCLEKAETVSESPYYGPSRWHELLCAIYRASGQEEKLTAQLRTMLLLGKLDCYDELKRRLQAAGRWEREYRPLLREVTASRPRYEYMRILAREAEVELLMEQVREAPDSVFTYVKLLAKQYPEQVFTLCVSQIRTAAERAQNRRDYQKLCALLSKLADFGGAAEARRLIIELREAYPRRRAMQEELDYVERQIVKRS
ncbi:hypothetical protein CE91St41_13650 [Oscillospiraceae bacterium]|nr:hypothetical protein CE91St40_23890 [Oscillospiraceae bacterium]BDF74476.1 hypothetical protein CE91St41_13650 [Oscillospiraceae bacterium]